MTIGAGMPDQFLDTQLDQATLIANGGFELVAPVDGYLREFRATIQAAITTGGTLSVFINTVAVPGLVITVPNAAVKGTRYVAIPTAKSPLRTVAKGDRIEIRTAGFGTAGVINTVLQFGAADLDGVMPY